MASLLDDTTTWAEFGRRHLDPRVAKALTTTLGLERPTLVQSRGIPVALEGKDLLCRARTGSGKTLCYAVPLVQRLLAAAEAKGTATALGGIVLVPTKELVVQVHGVISQLLAFSFDVLSAECLLSGQTYSKAELPSVLVTTPSSLLGLLKQRRGTMRPLSELLKVLVVDEADLMFSFGYEDDMREMCAMLPATYQAMLVSATLSEEVEQLKGLMLHKPVLLKLEEPRVTGKLSQFYFVCRDGDKYLVLYTLLKLQLVQGKKLIFVKNIDNAYRLKIFLERFSINSAVLNAQLPHGSRQNIIESFNQNVIDLLIATDAGLGDSGLTDENAADQEEANEKEEEGDELDQEDKQPAGKKRKKLKRKATEEEAPEGEKPARLKKKAKKAREAAAAAESAEEQDAAPEAKARAAAAAAEGSAAELKTRKKRRGKAKAADDAEEGKGEQGREEDVGAELADTEAATIVVKQSQQQTRRFGHRQKQADEHYSLTRGVDLNGVSTVINADVPTTVRDYVHRVGRCARGGASGTALTLCEEMEKARLEPILRSQAGTGAMSELKPLPLQMSDAERFRYRVEDQAHGLKKKAVLKYLARELQLEALHSEKLQEYFEENPEDKKALQRAQRQLRETKTTLQHLQAVPSYLVPDSFDASTPVQQAVREDAAARGGAATGQARRRKLQQARRSDPLQALEPTGRAKTRPWLTREAMVRKDAQIDAATANVERLPPISGRKIWKVRHHKRVRKPTDTLGERRNFNRAYRTRRKKFSHSVF
uniref:RNA helicase n=2 Tax=Alexandrium monilatum TaxID=311494 RepID=A0A7S4W8V4_9DINO